MPSMSFDSGSGTTFTHSPDIAWLSYMFIGVYPSLRAVLRAIWYTYCSLQKYSQICQFNWMCETLGQRNTRLEEEEPFLMSPQNCKSVLRWVSHFSRKEKLGQLFQSAPCVPTPAVSPKQQLGWVKTYCGHAFLHPESKAAISEVIRREEDSATLQTAVSEVNRTEEDSGILPTAISEVIRREEDSGILPTVMIIGRPNVGKSALFNRLTRRRAALVYNTPDGHVTRDIREGIAKLGGLRFKVLDSAGLDTFHPSESILGRTVGISAATIRKCHIALFLVDGRAGLQPMDKDVGKWVRKIAPQVPVVVAMNKAEGVYHDPSGRLLAALGETHELGFGDPVPISAEDGEGMGDLFDTLRPLLKAAEDAIQAEQPKKTAKKTDMDGQKVAMQLAIVGRPNVGKSTLVNTLLREERVLTGHEPGLTRDSVYVQFPYKDEIVRLVDTAGWMQRANTREGPAGLSALQAKKGIMSSHVVALILDGEEIAKTKSSLRHAEASLARWTVEEGRGLIVVVNKMDLLSDRDKGKLRSAVPQEIQTTLPQVSGVPVIFTSALEKTASPAVMRNAFECYEKWNARFSTAQLNRWLGKVFSRHPRSLGSKGGGYGAKVRYVTQVKARPPTFVVFVSGSGQLEDTDLRFIASGLREDFGLSGIPLRIFQRSSKESKKKF